MCGISGFINFDNFIDGKKIIDEMNRSLRHRGPDLSGTWNNEAKNIFLGHTRLSIIDLSNNGNQPMISRSGNKILIFNGEIYNHKLIRDKLSFNNWKGNSDSETLLECINEIGIENTLSEITGMFAFAIFDNNKQTLHLVRDRLGEKPLYYFYDKNKFIFASELKSILKFPKIQKTLNKNAINHFLKYSYIPSPITIYENIYKLNPSELISLKITKNKIQKKISSYWSVKTQKNFDYKFSEKELVSSLENKIINSVQMQMQSDVPTGAFLSGGIDSSLVVSVMNKISNQKINTFCIGFEDQNYDESNYSKQIAEYLNTKHHCHIFKSKDLLGLIENLSDVYDEPFADSSQLPTILLSNFARKHVKVALSGDGADELFGGYNRYNYLLKIFKYAKIFPISIRLKLIKIVTKLSPTKLYKLYVLINFIFFNKLKFSDPIDKIYKIIKILEKNELDEMYLELLSHKEYDSKIMKDNFSVTDLIIKKTKSYDKSDILNFMMQFDLNNYLVDDILVKIDRAAMINSLETRAPFLDRNIVEFSNNLDSSYKIRNRSSKWILKQILKKYLPINYFNRPKKGFGVPLSSWIRNDLKELSLELFDKKLIERQSIFNYEKINDLLQKHLSKKQNNQYMLWNIIVFQNWYLKNFNE